MKPLKKWKCELADGAGDFEESRDHWAFFKQRWKGIVFAVRIFQRKCGSFVPGHDVSHLTFRS
jgi:hypothetical protein